MNLQQWCNGFQCMPGHQPKEYCLCISPQCTQPRKLICRENCLIYHHRNHKVLSLQEIAEFLNQFEGQPNLHDSVNQALEQIEQLRIELNKLIDSTIERIKHHFGRFWYEAQRYAQEFKYEQSPQRIELLAKQLLQVATIKDDKLKIKIVKPLKPLQVSEMLQECMRKLETLTFTNDVSSIKPENWVNSFANHIRTITSDGEVWCLQPIKNELLSGGDDNKITLWNMQTLQKVWHSKKHRSIITALTASSDFKIVVMGSAAGFIKFWDLDNKKTLYKLKQHTDHVSSLHFSNDNSMLLSSGWDCNIIQWTMDRKQISFKYFQKEHNQKIYRVQYNHDNKIIASCSLDKTIRLWDYQGLAQLGEPLTGHSEKVDWIQFAQQYLVSCSQSEKLVIIWDYIHRQQIWNIECEAHRFALSPDGKLLACVRKDIRVYEIATKQQIGDAIQGHTYIALSIAWSNRFLVTGCQDKTIRIYGIPNT